MAYFIFFTTFLLFFTFTPFFTFINLSIRFLVFFVFFNFLIFCRFFFPKIEKKLSTKYAIPYKIRLYFLKFTTIFFICIFFKIIILSILTFVIFLLFLKFSKSKVQSATQIFAKNAAFFLQGMAYFTLYVLFTYFSICYAIPYKIRTHFLKFSYDFFFYYVIIF